MTDADRLAREQEIRDQFASEGACFIVTDTTMNRSWVSHVEWLLDQLAAERQARERLEQALRQIPLTFGLAGAFDQEYWLKWSDVRALLRGAGE